jgi:hypothetical protein
LHAKLDGHGLGEVGGPGVPVGKGAEIDSTIEIWALNNQKKLIFLYTLIYTTSILCSCIMWQNNTLLQTQI